MSNATRVRVSKPTSTAERASSMSFSTSTSAPVWRHQLDESSAGADSALDIRSIESAVFAHIQALRTLGHERINTSEIARALGLSHAKILIAAKALKDKGVKPSRS